MFCKKGSSLLADRWTSQSDLAKLESSDCEYGSACEGPQLGSDYHCQKNCRILYLANQHFHGVIIDTPALSDWPLTAHDIRDSAQQLIPPQLFNCLSWITGSADVVDMIIVWKLVMTYGRNYYLLLRTLYIYIYIYIYKGKEDNA